MNVLQKKIMRASAIAASLLCAPSVYAFGPTVYDVSVDDSGRTLQLEGTTTLHQMTVSLDGPYPDEHRCFFFADLRRPLLGDLRLAEFYMAGSQPIVHINFPPFVARGSDTIRLVPTGIGGSNPDGTGDAQCPVNVRLFVNERFRDFPIGGPRDLIPYPIPRP
jgi:hypothetical protein